MRCAIRDPQSRRGSHAATEEFFVSANHFQGFCVSHFDADGTGDLTADIAQQRSFGNCRYGASMRRNQSNRLARAKEFTGNLAFERTVTVKVRDTDRYGRAVAEIICQTAGT